MSRSDYNTSIINLLDAHLGIVFERYLDKKTPHKIARSDGSEMDVPDISINGMSVFPLDPFYNAFRDNTNNQWTLTRSFTTESVFDKDGPNEKTINVKSSMHIVPQVDDIKTKNSAKSLYSRMQRLEIIPTFKEFMSTVINGSWIMVAGKVLGKNLPALSWALGSSSSCAHS